MKKGHNQNCCVLHSFVQYCEAHSEERFWQALRNWSGKKFIFAGSGEPDNGPDLSDTFYWEKKDG